MAQNVGLTANDLVLLAAKQLMVVGVGQTLQAQDVQDCFNLLNMLLGEWSEERTGVYHLIDVTFTPTGAASYTVGPGGTINTTFTPYRLESCQFINNGVTLSVRVIQAHEDYNRIAVKSLQGVPAIAFLDSAYPLASLYVWPIPSSLYQVVITVMAQLTQFQYLTDAVNLPAVYHNALMYNLAVACAPLFGVEPSPTVERRARATRQALRKINTRIPMAQMPEELIRNGIYNPWSDRLN